jgi:Bacterial Ig domain
VPVNPSSGGGTPPIVVVHGPACTVSGTPTLCQTANRQVTLDLSGSSSPTGNNPLTFLTVSNELSAAVLGSTSSHPSVQLAELAGDYFFTITVTDSKGNSTTVTVDLLLTNTSPQN